VTHLGPGNAESGTGDLGEDSDQALSHFDGRRLHDCSLRGEPDPALGIVIEALGEPEILDPDGVGDTTDHILRLRGEPAATREDRPIEVR
jgi:hypothetical protein